MTTEENESILDGLCNLVILLKKRYQELKDKQVKLEKELSILIDEQRKQLQGDTTPNHPELKIRVPRCMHCDAFVAELFNGYCYKCYHFIMKK